MRAGQCLCIVIAQERASFWPAGFLRTSNYFGDVASGFVVKRVCLNWIGRELPETRVRADLVVLTPEVFHQDLRICTVLEPLHAQALIPELAVE